MFISSIKTISRTIKISVKLCRYNLSAIPLQFILQLLTHRSASPTSATRVTREEAVGVAAEFHTVTATV